MLHDKVFAGTTVPSIAPSKIPSNDPTTFQPKKTITEPFKARIRTSYRNRNAVRIARTLFFYWQYQLDRHVE